MRTMFNYPYFMNYQHWNSDTTLVQGHKPGDRTEIEPSYYSKSLLFHYTKGMEKAKNKLL